MMNNLGHSQGLEEKEADEDQEGGPDKGAQKAGAAQAASKVGLVKA